MKRKRTFTFKKTEHYKSDTWYTVITNAALLKTISNNTKYFGLHLSELSLHDCKRCKFSIDKIDKETWQRFCISVIEDLADYIEDYTF